jgi:hypothetical protein
MPPPFLHEPFQSFCKFCFIRCQIQSFIDCFSLRPSPKALLRPTKLGHVHAAAFFSLTLLHEFPGWSLKSDFNDYLRDGQFAR